MAMAARMSTGIAALACAAAVAACGGSGTKSKKTPTSTSTTASAPAPASSRPSKKFPHALLARCAIGPFEKPNVAPLMRGRVPTWQVIYQLPRNAPQIIGQPGTVTLIELPPSSPQGNLAGAHSVFVKGRLVRLVPQNPRTHTWVARWKTRRAVYIALIVDGSEPMVRRFIGCMP